MSETKQDPSTKERVLFYYPGTSKKKPRRVVLAGIVIGNQILVAESIAYPGKKATIVETRDVETQWGPGTATLSLRDGRLADVFNKKRGREIALNRARGYSLDASNNKIPCKQKLAMVIEIPEGEHFIGKLFVSEITKMYPPKAPKARPETTEPTFTIEQIKKYVTSQDSLGDIAYNLSAENILKASEATPAEGL